MWTEVDAPWVDNLVGHMPQPSGDCCVDRGGRSVGRQPGWTYATAKWGLLCAPRWTLQTAMCRDGVKGRPGEGRRGRKAGLCKGETGE